ncbi:MAG: hypothetical protein ABI178_00480 [Rhodanobacter sp.]
MSELPPRREVKITHVPSLEKLAFESSSGLARKGLALLPSASAMNMSLFNGAKLAKAIS